MQTAREMSPAVSPTPAPPAMPQPGFGVGQVIAKTFSTWARHVVVFSLLTLVAYVPFIVYAVTSGFPMLGINSAQGMTTIGGPVAMRAGALPVFPPGFWLANLLTMLLFLVEVGAMTHGVIHHLAGKRVSLGAMIAAGLRRSIPVLVVGFLCYLMIVVGLVLLIVPGVFLACALVGVVPAVVVERPGIFGAIRRSFALTKGHRFAIFVALLVLFIVTVVVSALANILGPVLVGSFSPMLGTLVGLAVKAAFGTLFWIAPSVVYHDLRVAKEGVATAELAAIFE